MQDQTTSRADLWSGLFWIVLGAAITVHSAGMPVPRNLGATTMTGPGFLPMLLGGALALMGLTLAVRALRAPRTDAPETAEPVSNGRAFLALVLMVAYAAALATRQPFVPSTVLFVTVFVTLFNWQGQDPGRRIRTVLGALAMAAACAFAIEFVFEQLFFVRLP